MYCGLLCWVVLCATDGECRDALDFMSVGVLVGPPCYRQSCEDALDWMIVGVVTCQYLPCKNQGWTPLMMMMMMAKMAENQEPNQQQQQLQQENPGPEPPLSIYSSGQP
ncbi:hypothetical protein O3P69_008223 [Scylla paramamosain]|uniref:Uncharacterized protein n=1 Tax=Scylla paramamosain TaxID=85552 RepID=A0AAW0T1T5_SCYPA